MGTFRLLQFNMQFGQVWDDADPDDAPVCIEETAKTLSLYNADLILLQEMEKALPNGKQSQPPPNFEYLKKVFPDYHSVFAYPPADERELPFGIGLAIFSRFPILESQTVTLPGAPVVFEFDGVKTSPTDRTLLKARIELDGRSIQILNTHLQAYFMINASGNDYPEQKDIVLKEAMAVEGPMVLAGDFNSVPKENLLKDYEKAGLQTMQRDINTWKRMPFVLDHIFYNNHLILKGGSVDEVSSSDHHVLVADFKV
jgi:endonuclease/exonuclease/phosphatase family metal-dependent hydrolase